MKQKKKDLYNKNKDIIKIILIFIILIIIYNIIKNLKMSKLDHYNPLDNSKQTYYFDNNATTYIYDKKIKNIICEWMNCGNPSNTLHKEGQAAKKELDKDRKIVADDLDVDVNDIYFTGCATESNSILINGIVNGYLLEHPNEKITIITSSIEHPSVLNLFKFFKTNPKINVIILPVRTNQNDEYYGRIHPDDLENAIKNAKHKIILCSIMYANNETGAINNMKKIGLICKKYKIFLHSDCTQAIGKFIIHPKDLNISAITCSGHKLHAPKGVGLLYLHNGCGCSSNSKELCSKFCANSQENHIRGGTENIAFISAFAYALKEVHKNRDKKNEILHNYKLFITKNLENNNCILINPKVSLDNTMLFILKDINTCNKMFAKMLSDKYNICIGVSSACQSGEISHVLQSMKINPKYKDKIIRISLCDYNTKNEIQYLVNSIIDLLSKVRN